MRLLIRWPMGLNVMHARLIECSDLLLYSAPVGLCHGFAFAGILAIRARDLKKFKQRYEWLSSLKPPLDESFLNKIDEVRQLRIKILFAAKNKVEQEMLNNNADLQRKHTEVITDNIQKKLGKGQFEDILDANQKKEFREKIQLHIQQETSKLSLEIQEFIQFDPEAFFNTIWLYHYPGKFKQIYDPLLKMNQKNAYKSSQYVKPIILEKELYKYADEKSINEEILTEVLFEKENNRIGLYSKDDLTNYFNSLKTAIYDENYKNPVTFTLNSFNHTISISFDPDSQSQAWTLIDANYGVFSPIVDTNILSELVAKSLFGGFYTNFASKFYCLPGEENSLKQVLKKCAQMDAFQAIHEINGLKSVGYDSHKTTLLMTAARYGQLNTMKELLAHKADPKQANLYSETPIYLAADCHNIDCVKLLLDQGVDLTVRNNEGLTPLHAACIEGDVEVAKLFIEQKAAIDVTNNNGTTPLGVAIQVGAIDVVKLLIDNKANISVVNKFGVGPLYTAVQNGHKDILELLLKQTPKPNLDAPIDAMIKILRREAKKCGGLNKFNELLNKYSANVQQDKIPGFTPLLAAIFFGHDEIVKCLLDEGANRHHQFMGVSIFEIAHTINSPVLDRYFHKQAELLFDAINKGNLDMIDELAAEGFDLSPRNEDGQTPMMLAIEQRKLDLIQRLIDKGANINDETKDGITPLNFAINLGDREIVKLLINNGANINIVNDYGLTPISVASEKQANILDILLSHQENQKDLTKIGMEVLKSKIMDGPSQELQQLFSKLYAKAKFVELPPLFAAIILDRHDLVKDLLTSDRTMYIKWLDMRVSEFARKVNYKALDQYFRQENSRKSVADSERQFKPEEQEMLMDKDYVLYDSILAKADELRKLPGISNAVDKSGFVSSRMVEAVIRTALDDYCHGENKEKIFSTMTSNINNILKQIKDALPLFSIFENDEDKQKILLSQGLVKFVKKM